jgi:hypothetical protein
VKYIYVILATFILYGCSGQQMADNITKAQIAMSGNKPPAFFRIENFYTMNHYAFETEDFSFKSPFAKEKDFSQMGGWFGGSHRDGKTIVLNLDPKKIGISYQIVVSTDTYESTEIEKEIENGNVEYLEKLYHQYNPATEISLRSYGKENYPCMIIKSYNDKYGKKEINYACYKVNPKKSKVKSVTINLTYTKSPNLPKKYQHLAKEYTYEDLLKRSQRVLDSLYIKDGWDE